MKQAFFLLALCAGLASCSGESDKKHTQEEYTLANSEETMATDSSTGANLTAVAHQPQIDTNATKIGTGPTGGAVALGAKLIEGSDCLGCHRENEKLLGPAYKAVAEKYPSNAANISMLAGKIIQGGKGNWGDIAMTPDPGLSESDAQEMARYILSLR